MSSNSNDTSTCVRVALSMMQKKLFCGLIVASVFVLGFYQLALRPALPDDGDWSGTRNIPGVLLQLEQKLSENRDTSSSSTYKPGADLLAEDDISSNRSTSDGYEPLMKIYSELYEKIPKTFHKRYKNPCFMDHESKKLRCLPYFYLVGMPKCGTTDLWAKLVGHPQVIDVPKEPHWWARRRNGWTKTPIHQGQVNRVRQMTKMKDDSSIEWYFNWFEAFAGSQLKKNKEAVCGDGSVSTGFMSLENWRGNFPGSKEPPFSLADLMYTLQPSAKIVFILREPVSRYFSAHLYNGGHNAKSFSNAVEKNVECMQTCIKNHSDRVCAYQQACDQVFRGMYIIYLTDWLKAYGRDQVHVVRLDDWMDEPVEEYKRLLDFLELDPISDEAIRRIVKSKVMNSQSKKKKSAGAVSNSTKKLLQDFYRPFNQRLAALLNDNRFLWDYG